MEQVWPGDNSSTNTKSWPPILGSPSNFSSIVGAFRDSAEVESESVCLRYFFKARLLRFHQYDWFLLW